MRLLTILSFALYLMSCNSPIPQGNTKNNLVSFVDSLYQSHLDSGHLAGGAILVAKGDSILLSKGYGLANI